jgi:hypothetical protein
MKIKKIAEEILKQAASVPLKHVVTLQFDKNSMSNLEKLFGLVKGFGDITSNKIQVEVPITINSDIVQVVDFEIQLNNILKRKALTNCKFTVVRSPGRPTRMTRPLR